MFDFEAFFLEHHNRLYHMLYQMVGTQQEAEDLAQEAFLRFHKHFDSIYPDKHKAWLFRVAVNLGYTALQSRKRHRLWSQQESHTQTTLQQSRVSAPQTEQALGVQRTLASLPARQSKILYLYASGLSYDELATALDVRPSSVSQLLLRAKHAFKQHYDARH